ncbi:MAG: hypothetical protein AB1798_18145, partial [Spirochaetota bacterium]
LIIAVSALTLSSGRSSHSIEQLLNANAAYIRTLKGKGKSDEYIAESFLKTLRVKNGIFTSLAKRRVLRYLAKMDVE